MYIICFIPKMNFDISPSNGSQDGVEDEEHTASIRNLVTESASGGTHDTSNTGNKHATVASATLLLPTPMNGPKTTSTKLAEKSYIWSENKLYATTSNLDKQLHHSMSKLNADRLEIVNDLAKLKRSSSSETLTSMNDKHFKDRESSGKSRPYYSPDIRRKVNKETVSPLARGTDPKHKHDVAAGIEIHITSDDSLDDEDLRDCNIEYLRCMSSPTVRRHCREERSQAGMVENVIRRYAKQTSPKSAIVSSRNAKS